MARSLFLSIFALTSVFSNQENLELDIISYEKLINREEETLSTLKKALYENGIIAVRGVPGQIEAYEKYLSALIAFHKLPENIKTKCSPKRASGDILGYELGAESYNLVDIDNLKSSYYAHYPDCIENKWPEELDLKTPFLEMTKLMADTGETIMRVVGLLGKETGIELAPKSRLGRMLYYKKSSNNSNPNWCGAHFDHSLFTALLPATYFRDGKRIEEPEEAGLFVRQETDAPFKKVQATDRSLMLFQVGEFAQLVTNDAIRATQHRVNKANGAVERYTLAMFCDAPMDTTIESTSVITADPRYKAAPGEPYTYGEWCQESYKRFLVKDNK